VYNFAPRADQVFTVKVMVCRDKLVCMRLNFSASPMFADKARGLHGRVPNKPSDGLSGRLPGRLSSRLSGRLPGRHLGRVLFRLQGFLPW
jgi:hypothetical protein